MKINTEIIQNSNNNNYSNDRKHLVNFLRHLNSKLKFRSQTFFLAVYYMDLIFNVKISEQNYPEKIELMAISCLLIAAKFDENDPNIPDLYLFQSISSQLKNKFYFRIEELKKSEIVCIQLLDYKLNYFTTYHFIIYFFTHGIVLNDEIEENEEKMKIVENIYSLSRDLLDIITERGKDFIFYNNLHIAISIILFAKSILLKNNQNQEENNFLNESNINQNNSFNFFEIIYKIKFSNYQEIYKTIDTLYDEYKKLKEDKKKLNLKKNLNLENKNLEINYKNPNSYINFVSYASIPTTTTNKDKKIENLNEKELKISENLKPRATSVQNNIDNLNIKKKIKNRQSSNTSKNINQIVIVEEELTDNNFDYLKTHVENKNEKKTVSYISGNILQNKNNLLKLSTKNIFTTEENEGIISPNIINKKFDYENIKRNFNRIRTKNESFVYQNNIDKEDLLKKTKKIFRVSNLIKNNNINFDDLIYPDDKIDLKKIENISNDKKSTPATIIINNNININTYITGKNYIFPQYDKKQTELNYDKYYNNKSDIKSKNNSNYKNEKYSHKPELNLDKENIRKKIDYEIEYKNKFTNSSSTGFNYDRDLLNNNSGSTNNIFSYRNNEYSSGNKYEKVLTNSIYNSGNKNLYMNNNNINKDKLNHTKYSNLINPINEYNLQINYDVLKRNKY